jgi:hypothetical protein
MTSMPRISVPSSLKGEQFISKRQIISCVCCDMQDQCLGIVLCRNMFKMFDGFETFNRAAPRGYLEVDQEPVGLTRRKGIVRI